MVHFSLPLLLSLLTICAILLIAEWRGIRTTLSLEMKGDVKRETRWLAQYGQTSCTVVAALLVWQLDRSRTGGSAGVLIAVFGSAGLAAVLKRLFSRVRPGRENAGKFLGPTLRHANWRESFPSSHSACAASLSVMLSLYYPAAAFIFWGLAAGCAALRYILDAHWPSDIFAGFAVGYSAAHFIALLMRMSS